jgi:ribosome-associated protein
MSEPFEDDEDQFDEGPSKSERKRQSHDLQALGEMLIALPQEELDELPLPEILRDAVLLARRITKHGGLYRQKQYIGKLMRKIDAEPIRAAIAAREQRSRSETVRFHRIETWRNRLIEDASALALFLVDYPQADRETLNRLAGQARWEREHQRPPRAARELFTAIETTVVTTASPGDH